MTYLVFDLDATLVNFTRIVWLLLNIFQPKASSTHMKLPNVQTSENYNWDMAKAYQIFVESIVNRELSSNPLGIMRPGISKVLKYVIELRKKNVVKGVIMYTNNSNEAMVNFAKHLLETASGTKIFDDCMFVHHPLRAKRSKYPDYNKTWVTLRDLLVEGLKAPQSIQPKDVLFYDDQNHYDLISTLTTNYIKVPEYNYIPNIKQIFDYALASFEKADILKEGSENFNDFKNVVQAYLKLNQANVSTKEQVLTKLETYLIYDKKQSLIPVPDEDNGINLMLKSLKNLTNAHENNNVNNFKMYRNKGTKKPGGGKKRKSLRRKMPTNPQAYFV
jgi:hypothetical protein